MIDNNILLNNPLIPPGYYFAKVVDIESEPADYFFPKLQVTLQLHPMYGLPQETCFRAILFPSNNAFYHYKNFFNTFMLGQDTNDFDKAVGVWGSVEIYSSEFADIEYSAVRFCYQPLVVRIEAGRVGRDEIRRNGFSGLL